MLGLYARGHDLRASSSRALTLRPPNIVYLHSHDTGRQIEPYGPPVDTPNLLRLAGQGVLFRAGVLRGADVLEEPCVPPDRAVRALQRDASFLSIGFSTGSSSRRPR